MRAIEEEIAGPPVIG